MELLDTNINLILIHDVIGDSMINYIKESSIGFMQRAGVLTINNPAAAGETIVADYRTASLHYLANNDVRLNSLDKKIGRMTGLNVANGLDPKLHASERLQVASSTFGGHCEPHLDSVIYEKLNQICLMLTQ